MIKRDSDSWETPQELFGKLDDEFGFDVDICATNENTKKHTYYIDYLTDVISDEYTVPSVGFMNPPYSNPLPFVKKAFSDVLEGKFETIVCLLKCDTSTKTFHVFWDYDRHQPKPGCQVRFIPKRLKFELNGEPSASAMFPSVIVVFSII